MTENNNDRELEFDLTYYLDLLMRRRCTPRTIRKGPISIPG